MVSELGVVDLGVDSTHASGGVVHGHVDESFVSPASAPGVAEGPVGVKTVGAVVSHNNISMVNGGAAVTAQNTTFVGLVSMAGGVDGDSERLAIDGIHHRGVVTRDFHGTFVGERSLGCIVLASSLFLGVAVISVQHSLVSFEVSEG